MLSLAQPTVRFIGHLIAPMCASIIHQHGYRCHLRQSRRILCNPPNMVPCPDFAKLRALRQHIVKALKQIESPQSFIHGWSGFTMAPAMYALLEPNAFVAPVNPGPAPVYMPFTTPAAIKTVDAMFERDKNYFVSYKNINCACFGMLNELVPNQYKVSNNPPLIGWRYGASLGGPLCDINNPFLGLKNQ